MNSKPDSLGRQATRPYHIPFKGWWQVVQRVAVKVGHDNLSVVSAGCAFYALFAIFPALTASISLYGLTTDAATVEREFGMLKAFFEHSPNRIVGRFLVVGQTNKIRQPLPSFEREAIVLPAFLLRFL